LRQHHRAHTAEAVEKKKTKKKTKTKKKKYEENANHRVKVSREKISRQKWQKKREGGWAAGPEGTTARFYRYTRIR